MTAIVNQEAVQQAYRLLTAPGQVVEIRALEASFDPSPRYTATIGGYFDNIEILTREISRLRQAQGIYITLQPCNDQLLHKAKNKLIPMKNALATPDKDITAYRWLLIDSDPQRVTGISSSDDEHNQALAHSTFMRDELRAVGWPDPISADSGNGAHLLYRIDLPTDEKDLVHRTLTGLAERYSTDAIKVDTTVFNPARICKLYGTLACKGDNTTERPHRFSRLLEVPTDLLIVTRELLEQIATPLPTQVITPQPQRRNTYTTSPEGFTAEQFLNKHHISVKSSGPYEEGTRYKLDACVWDASHTDNSACVYQDAQGRLGASCSHNSCSGKGWREFRLVFEPNAYDVKPQKQKATKAKPETVESELGEEREKEPTAITILMQIAENATFMRTPEGALYAKVPINGHTETLTVSERGSQFKQWLIHQFKLQKGIAPNSEALSLVMSGVVADATFSPNTGEVCTRTAYHNGKIYLDLADTQWRCVEISSTGWRVISSPPVHFRRPNGMLPLPVPEAGGTLDDLKELINAKDEKDYMLLTAWLVGALHPTGPYPVLSLNGQRGSAKTKTTTILRNLIDPNKAPHRPLSKDMRDTMVAAQNNRIIALDNLSSLPLWMSDTLCRIATGAGMSAHALYTNDDEIVFSVKRPIVLNGIEDSIITQGDLLNRTMMVTLEPPEEYLPEEDLDELFEEMHPKLLGALLSVISLALRQHKNIHLENAPRMADFARWITSAEPALKWKSGHFLEIYTENQVNATSIITEASPTAQAIIFLMTRYEKWEGLTSELFTELLKQETFKDAKTAPKSANKLSGQLKRIAPSLRVQGINITQLPRVTKGAMIIIEKCTPPENDKNHVDKNGLNVDRFAENVDTLASDVDKNKRIYITANQLEEGDEGGKMPIYVDNVDKNTCSSTLRLKKEKEEKASQKTSETPIPDEQQKVSTLSTLSTQAYRDLYKQLQAHLLASEQSEFAWNATEMLPRSIFCERVGVYLKSGIAHKQEYALKLIEQIGVHV